MVKSLPSDAEDVRTVGSIPAPGRSPGEGNGSPLQYSCQKTPMNRGAWQVTVHGVTKKVDTKEVDTTWELNNSGMQGFVCCEKF